MKILLNAVRVVGIILVIIGCIISIPVFIGALIGGAFMLPGLKLCQVATDTIDAVDADDPIEVVLGQNSCQCHTPKCAK